MTRTRARGFALLETMVGVAIATAVIVVVLAIAAQSAQHDADRSIDDAARRTARNVATDLRAAMRYDAASVAAITGSGGGTWNVDGFAVSANVSGGELQVTVSGGGANPASIAVPLVREAPPPGARIGPGA